jgi:hypothetical protein
VQTDHDSNAVWAKAGLCQAVSLAWKKIVWVRLCHSALPDFDYITIVFILSKIVDADVYLLKASFAF